MENEQWPDRDLRPQERRYSLQDVMQGPFSRSPASLHHDHLPSRELRRTISVELCQAMETRRRLSNPLRMEEAFEDSRPRQCRRHSTVGVMTSNWFSYDDSDRSMESDLISLHSSHLSGTREEELELAHKETRQVYYLRWALLVLLASTAVAVSVLGFVLARNNERDDFETAYSDQAARLIDAFKIITKRRIQFLESFSLAITSHSQFSNSSWPFVTLPDFERRGRSTSQLSEVMSIMMVPLVKDKQRDEWERYSIHNQDWFKDSLQVRAKIQAQSLKELSHARRIEAMNSIASSRDLQSQHSGNNTLIPESIYSIDGDERSRDPGPGPYLPVWQIAPVIPNASLVNLNLLSHSGYRESLDALLTSEETIIGRSFDFLDPSDAYAVSRRNVLNLFLENYEDTKSYGQDPMADINSPIFDVYGPGRKVVGLLSCAVYWKSFFVDILSESASGLVLVLKNTCDQQYTYEVNKGSIDYIGPGDLHKKKYESFEVSSDNDTLLGGTRDAPGSCLYSIHIYPSEALENEYITSKPTIYVVVLVCIFLFTSAVFLLYDCLVERRQRVVMGLAVASNAIVSSLFPKVVRDRLYKKTKRKKTNEKGNGNRRTSGFTPDQDSQNGGQYATRRLLQNFLADFGVNQDDSPQEEEVKISGELEEAKPIAEQFENCTVLFADIAGFTSWSSGREPSQVFELLESLYSSFDKIAKRRRVFKVETIGDCYLAVTGLPVPQKDHAVRMSLFAHECMRRMKALLSYELREKLGGDTSCLTMRFGLHSGPVTAGVLRGDKSRFQLFGDTVNTAARMENTGERDRIHLSQATALLIVQARKSSWLEERDDWVSEDGEPEMKTYWLKPRNRDDLRRSSVRSTLSRLSVSNALRGDADDPSDSTDHGTNNNTYTNSTAGSTEGADMDYMGHRVTFSNYHQHFPADESEASDTVEA